MSALALALYEATDRDTRIKFCRASFAGISIVMERVVDDKTARTSRAISEVSLKAANGLDFLFIHMIEEMTAELNAVPKNTGRPKTLRQFTEET